MRLVYLLWAREPETAAARLAHIGERYEAAAEASRLRGEEGLSRRLKAVMAAGAGVWGRDESAPVLICAWPDRRAPRATWRVGAFPDKDEPGGFDWSASGMVGKDISWVIGAGEGRKTFFRPDWAGMLERARAARRELLQYRRKYGAWHLCFPVDVMPRRALNKDGAPVQCQEDALVAFRRSLKKKGGHKAAGAEVKEHGLFFPAGAKVLAVIRGVVPEEVKDDDGETVVVTLSPTAYVVAEADLWKHVDNLKAVESTCRFVLGRQDREHFFLGWQED